MIEQASGAIRALPTGTVADQAISPDGRTLYTSRNGTITAFDLVSGTQTGSWSIGTRLGGIDVSADGRYLIATEQEAGPRVPTGTYTQTTDYYVYRLDLSTGEKTTYTNRAANGESYYFDASFLPDGTALLTQNYAGSGWMPLTTLDFATSAFAKSTQRYAQDGTLTATSDKTHIAFLPANISDAPVFVYTAGRGVTASHQNYADGVSGFNRGIQAISASGDLIVQGTGLNVYDGQLKFLTSLATRYSVLTDAAGLAFSPSGDRLYLLDPDARTVFALDTKTFDVLAGYPVGAPVIGDGSSIIPISGYGNNLTISADGKTLSVLGAVSVQLLDLTKVVSDAGTVRNDTLTGDGSANVLYGFDGNDVLDGGGGPDRLYGGPGNDVYHVDHVGDQIYEAANQGQDTVYSSVGLTIPAEVETLILTGRESIDANGSGRADTLIGNDGHNRLYAGAGDDILVGNGGDDVLNGGTGNDRMSGGAGDDTYYVDSPADVVIEEAGEGKDTVLTDLAYRLGDNVDNLTLTGVASVSGTGNALANTIWGNGADNLLQGLAGDDVLAGGFGNDRIRGGAGIDTAFFSTGAASSTVRFDGGTLYVTGFDGRDVLTGVERLTFDGTTIDVEAARPVGLLYQGYMGRAAIGAELVYWTGEIGASRATTATVRQAILNDTAGRAYTDVGVYDLYRTLGGREPDAGELTYWRGQLAAGRDLDDVRDIILADPLGRTAAGIIDLYDTYGGREPVRGELDYWRGQLASGGTLAGVRSAILNDPLGRGHTADEIADLYADYGGRAPTAGEIATWQGLIAGGLTFDDARGIIVADGLGQSYLPTRVTAEYREHFGRDPSAGEVSAWRGLVNGGTTYDQLTDTLLRDGGAAGAGVQRFQGTAAADVFEVGGGRDAVVAGFDPLRDLIALGTASAGGLADPLRALDARQVFALDGTPDVLLTAADGRELLLTGVQLDDLSAGNFQFG